MQLLSKLLTIKPPHKQQLIDVALLLSLLPLLFALESFVILFLVISVYFIFKKEQRSYEGGLLFALGALLIGGAFLNSYNFSDFSRMQFFVSLISSALLFAVVLQRQRREINFYLLISPALLMLLGFFFFDTLSMLFYSLFAFFVLILLLIWSRMEAPLDEVLRLNSMLFLLSLPAVVVLFIAFPRISFEKADFGFRADAYSAGAFDGGMVVSDAPFIPQNKIVMELFFHKGVPKEEELYFRGSILYPNAAFIWEEQSGVDDDVLADTQEIIEYDLLMHPHGKKHLLSLGIPLNPPENLLLGDAMTLKSKTELYETKRYRLQGALHYRLKSSSVEHALEVNATAHTKTANAMRAIRASSAEQKAQKLLDFFISQNLAYTIAPQNLQSENPVDSFLFEAKNGYCTHFASSFAIAARLLGIPSRVVSGYKADYESRVENYLVVKQKDAHAWVELYLGERGWVRFEPTATASKNLDTQTRLQEKQLQESLFYKINLQYMYVKYLINTWVLGFDRLKQMAILDSLLSDTLYLLKFVGALLLIAFIAFALVYLLFTSQKKDPLAKSMQPLFNFLQKRGYEKEPSQTLQSFLEQVQERSGVRTEQISAEYHKVKYAPKNHSTQNLKKLVKMFIKEHTALK